MSPGREGPTEKSIDPDTAKNQVLTDEITSLSSPLRIVQPTNFITNEGSVEVSPKTLRTQVTPNAARLTNRGAINQLKSKRDSRSPKFNDWNTTLPKEMNEATSPLSKTDVPDVITLQKVRL